MNWSKYNTSLKKRGSLNLFVEENISEWWYAKEVNKNCRPKKYSDKAIEVCINIRAFFRLPLRATEGLIESLFSKLELDLAVPSYTQVSRRLKLLKDQKLFFNKRKIFAIAIDSTGLKVYGEGEWKVRQHGADKRRTWRKLHLAIDTASQEIRSFKLTKNDVTDGAILKELAPQFQGRLNRILGDGAYDQTGCYVSARKIGARLIAPPRKKAKIQANLINPALIDRDNAISTIRRLGNDDEARKQWKKSVGYYKRSLAETAMFRFKRIFGAHLQSRDFNNQLAEVAMKVMLFNRITKGGIPKNM